MIKSWGRSNVFFEGEEDPPVIEEEKKETPPSPKKTFTQDEVNSFLAEEKRKAQKASERTIKELENLKKNQSLTEAEKQSLEDRIETIKNDYLSKEELAKKEAKKERDKNKLESDKLSTEIAKWKNLYEETTVDTGLFAAASSDPDIFNPQQIVDLLKPKTRLAEELDPDSGQPTGRFTSRVRFAGKNSEGKEVVLDLTPTEVVKQMKEMPDKYGNLFRSNANGGLGSNNFANRSKPGEVPTDPKEFREFRRKNPDYLKH